MWEDKKSMEGGFDAAYRQNRMSTAASLRQLHYLKVRAPVFGLVFAAGAVQAHTDWWTDGEDGIVSNSVVVLARLCSHEPCLPSALSPLPFRMSSRGRTRLAGGI